MEKETT